MPGTVSRTQNPSMNLQFFGVDTPMLKNGQPAPEAPMRATILHEFGHALGLLHEHQSPNANCDAEIDWDAAYKIGAGIGWDKAQVDRNFRQLANTTVLNATEVDRKSIMHYSLPPVLVQARQGERLLRGREPRAVGAGPQLHRLGLSQAGAADGCFRRARGTGHAQRGQAAGGRRRGAGLGQALRGAAEASGIEAGKASELVAEFRKSMTGK